MSSLTLKDRAPSPRHDRAATPRSQRFMRGAHSAVLVKTMLWAALIKLGLITGAVLATASAYLANA